MSPEGLKDAVADDWFDCLGNIAFFGGEPTLHPRLKELYQVVVDRWPYSIRSIVTWAGGKHALDAVRAMAEVNPQFMLCVSLDGSKEVHNERRGRDYAYDDVIKMLEWGTAHLVPFPKAYSLRVSFTATGKTAGELKHLFEIARRFDCDISMRAAATGSYFNTEDTRPGTEWTEEQLKEFDDILATIPDHDLAMPHFARAMTTFIRDGTHLPCRSPVDAIVVDPDLQARVCHELPPFSSLKEYPDFYAQSPKWLQAVEDARDDRCFRPSCFIDGPYSIAYAMTREGTFGGKRSHRA